jgi:hypothetical protein
LTANNLVVTQNIATINVTSELFVGTDANVYGNLTVGGNTNFGNVSITTANITTANVTSLIGTANTEIYNYIEATANSANAELLAAEYLAIAVALG